MSLSHCSADWSDLEYIRATKQHYAESKLLAEREAWRILKEEVPPGRAHLELATICPTQCLGPLLQPYLNQSTTAVVEHANGSKAKILNKGKVRAALCAGVGLMNLSMRPSTVRYNAY